MNECMDMSALQCGIDRNHNHTILLTSKYITVKAM
jgi:hypothetical protein